VIRIGRPLRIDPLVQRGDAPLLAVHRAPDELENAAMRRITGVIGLTLAVVAVIAASAAAANAHGPIEYGRISGLVASADGGPEADTLGSAARHGSRPGRESDRNGGQPAEPSAFVYRKDRYTPLGTVPGYPITVHNGFNNRGQIVGGYLVDAAPHGFLLERRIVTPIDPPAANQDVTDCNIQAFDINDRNQIVGYYPDARGTFHGFLYHKGRFTTIDHPDASDSARSGACDGMGFAASAAFGVDNHGRVVGQYVDADGVLHGYVWHRKRGFRTIDPPRGAGSVAADINDRGQVLVPATAPIGLSKGDGCF
jgi:uncharacterized membrane protein